MEWYVFLLAFFNSSVFITSPHVNFDFRFILRKSCQKKGRGCSPMQRRKKKPGLAGSRILCLNLKCCPVVGLLVTAVDSYIIQFCSRVMNSMLGFTRIFRALIQCKKVATMTRSLEWDVHSCLRIHSYALIHYLCFLSTFGRFILSCFPASGGSQLPDGFHAALWKMP